MSRETKHGVNGYIMIFTLLIIGAAMMIVTYIGHRGSFYLPFSHMVIAREKAKTLVLGGVQIVIAQLAQSDKKDEKDQGQQKEAKQEVTQEKKEEDTEKIPPAADQKKQMPEKDFLAKILPKLNHWQYFDLTQEKDGIDARLGICLMSEEGKININRIIDFKKHIIKGTDQKGWKAALPELCKAIERLAGGSELYQAFEKIAKEAKFEFNDATELITRKEFSHFKDILFYQPITSAKSKEKIYLTDIFTVWSSSDMVEPWLFSDSLCLLLGLQRSTVDDTKKRKEQVEGWLKNFKLRSNWQQDWDTIFKPIYGKELRSLPKAIDSILSSHFSPRFFSARIHATVDDVTQMVYVIFERVKSKHSAGEYDVEIKKLYWL